MGVKKLLTILFMMTLYISQSISENTRMPLHLEAITEQDYLISPQWVNVNDVNLKIDFENGEAYCSGKTRAVSGTTKISATFNLEKKTSLGWMLEKTWSKSSSTDTLLFFGTYPVSAGYTYRLSATIDVTRNDVVETVNTSVYGDS